MSRWMMGVRRVDPRMEDIRLDLTFCILVMKWVCIAGVAFKGALDLGSYVETGIGPACGYMSH